MIFFVYFCRRIAEWLYREDKPANDYTETK